MQQYPTICPYILVNDAQAFCDFMINVFGAVLKEKMMRDEHIIRHAEVFINESIIMFADATKDYPPLPCSMFVIVNNTDEVFQKAIEHGATSVMEPNDYDYGRNGGVKDPFGNSWWIASDLK